MAGNLQVNGVDFDNYYIPNTSFISYNDTTLWGWGLNHYNNTIPDSSSLYPTNFGSPKSSPVQIGILTSWSLIAQSLASGDTNNPNNPPPSGGYGGGIKTNGTLWMWGANYYGQIGNNSTIRDSAMAVRSPVQIGALTNWSKLACGGAATLAVKTDGTLWSWGRNTEGQLGQNDIVHRSSPVQVGALTAWSQVFAGAGGIAGYGSSFAIKTDGTLWSWGYNGSGQLGQGDIVHRSSPVQVGALTNWSLISGGQYHVLALKTDGTLWTWGNNGSGQLGQNDTTSRSSPVQIGALTTWSTIGTASQTSAAIKTDGTLWTWGRNVSSELGDGTTTSRSSPVQIGALTTWAKISGRGQINDSNAGGFHAIKSDGTLWAWGPASDSSIGDGTSVLYKSSPVQVGALTNWNSIYGGAGGAMALKNGIQ